MIRADLHVHTHYSVDSNMSLKKLIETCQRKGINCVAVADHGTTKGGRELSKIAPFKVIVCEEILTPYGEVMGLFLQEDIPNKLTLDETIKQIKEQGGLICIPHPFDRVRPSAFRNTAILESVVNKVDIIEVFNARSLFPGIEEKARSLAKKYNKCVSAGTDAHSSLEIGYAYVEMDDFNTKEEYLDSLSRGKIYGKKSSPLIHILSTTARLTKHKT
ncbi:MAG: PHP domain-containing protein [Chloroflexi bacterium]|nr:PHP domain-containing protein [Chloroflexota bacterium]